jgi:hypothetical protein
LIQISNAGNSLVIPAVDVSNHRIKNWHKKSFFVLSLVTVRRAGLLTGFQIPDPHGSAFFESLMRVRIRIRTEVKSKFRSFRGSKKEWWRAVNAQNEGMDAQNGG